MRVLQRSPPGADAHTRHAAGRSEVRQIRRAQVRSGATGAACGLGRLRLMAARSAPAAHVLHGTGLALEPLWPGMASELRRDSG